MTWALVQTGNTGSAFWDGANNVLTASFPAPVTSGNYILGHWTNDLGNGPATSVTDDKGNNYNIGTAFDITGDNQAHGWFWLANVTNAPQTITVNFAFPNVFNMMEFWEVSGVTNDPPDVVNGLWQSAPGNGADAVFSDATGTATAHNMEVAFGFYLEDRSTDPIPIGAGAGFTLQSQVTDATDQSTGNVILATETMDIMTAGTLAKATYTTSGGSGEYSTICVTLRVSGTIIITQIEGASFTKMAAKGALMGEALLGGRTASQSKAVQNIPTINLSGRSSAAPYSASGRAIGILDISAISQSQGKGRSTLGYPIFMGGRSLLKMANKGTATGILSILGRSQDQVIAGALSGGAAALRGRTASQSKGRGVTGTITLLQTSGRSASMSKGKGVITARTGVSGRTLFAMSNKAAGSGVLNVALFGRATSQSKGRAGFSGSATVIALAGTTASQFTARAGAVGVVRVTGRTLIAMADKARGAGASPLSARATSQAKGKGRLGGGAQFAAMAGRATSQSKGRGSLTGRLGISARATSQSKGVGRLRATAFVAARTAAQGKGGASLGGALSITGRASSASKGRGIATRGSGLGGFSAWKTEAGASGVQTTALLGRSVSQSKGQGTVSGQVPFVAMAGRTGSQSKARRANLAAFSPYIPPYYPPISPYVMPYQPFDAIIARYGIALTWERSHQCPCVFGNFGMTGSPDPSCQTCHGLGWYWDEPFGPFQGLITFIRLNPSPDEPGALMNEKWGVEIRQEPTVTIPFSAGLVWEEASVMDRFVEVDAIDRFNTKLSKGGVIDIPYQHQLTVQPTGAVTIYDEVNHEVIIVPDYTVNGTTVTIPDSYPVGTAYTVEFTAAKTYIAWRNAGAVPHDRPFGQVTEPKRFRFQTLDLWLRNKGG